MHSPEFWTDPERARGVLDSIKQIRAVVDPVNNIEAELDDLKTFYEIGRQDQDTDTLSEVDAHLVDLARAIDSVETQTLLSGKHDHRNCYLSIYAGTGGREACDMAASLLRMYMRYCVNAGFSVEEESLNSVEGGGIKDVTLRIRGLYAFGYLNCERGTHRFTRVSPYNAQGKRQTSFCTIDVVPELEETEVSIGEKDLDVVFFRRGVGPGGQAKNRVSTSVRVIHKPSGITVVISKGRSQAQNKKTALAILQAKMERVEEEKKEAERASRGKLETGWGTQIRNYSLCENWVKDTRTSFGIPNPQKVLDGDIQGFIDAELRRRVSLPH
jgi:peptide chain release factor 2